MNGKLNRQHSRGEHYKKGECPRSRYRRCYWIAPAYMQTWWQRLFLLFFWPNLTGKYQKAIVSAGAAGSHRRHTPSIIRLWCLFDIRRVASVTWKERRADTQLYSFLYILSSAQRQKKERKKEKEKLIIEFNEVEPLLRGVHAALPPLSCWLNDSTFQLSYNIQTQERETDIWRGLLPFGWMWVLKGKQKFTKLDWRVVPHTFGANSDYENEAKTKGEKK